MNSPLLDKSLDFATKIVLFYTLILLLLPTLFMKLFDMNITIPENSAYGTVIGAALEGIKR